MNSSKFFLRSCYYRIDMNEGFVTSSLLKFNRSVSKCEQSKVSSNADIFSGMIFRAALTNDNVTGNGRLATVDFYTQALALGVPAVLYATFPFFVCHVFY